MPLTLQGLTKSQVAQLQEQNGFNELAVSDKKNCFQAPDSNIS
jgi:hypothetical protein